MHNNPDILSITKQARRLIAHLESQAGSPDCDIRVGVALWAVLEDAEKAVERLKERLRAEAVARLGGQVGQAKLTAPDGSTCTVKVLPVVPKARDKAAVEEARQKLGVYFDSFFTTNTTYLVAKDLEVKIKAVPAPVQSIVYGAVDMQNQTPRVSFHDHPDLNL